MARCGCSGSCSCVVQGESPISVTGNGSVQQPYTVRLEMDGQTGCAAIVACLAGNLGPGLTYDEGSGKLQLKLSTDGGQTARFGSDQGLLVTGGTEPSPATCTRGISSLPAAPYVVGAGELGALLGAYSSPYSLQRSLADGDHIQHFHVATSSDNVGVVPDYWDHRIVQGRSTIYVSQDIRQMSAATCQSVIDWAGDPNDPVSYNTGEEAPPDRNQRGGGWYGWLEPRYQVQLVTDMLRIIDGKGVAMMDCTVDPNAEGGYGEEIAIIGAIRGVLQFCAQGWAMIAVAKIPTAVTVLNAGITAVLSAPKPSVWGETALPYPVADVTGAGIGWIVLSDRFADSVFTAYKNAGVQVLMQVNSRHSSRTRVQALGIRGAMCHDPVYYRGSNTAWSTYDYRTEHDAWEHRRMGVGQLTYMTDLSNVVSATGAVRGRTIASEQGLFLPEGFGRNLGRPSVLCGWYCPMSNPTSYRITWDMKFTSVSSVSSVRPKIGMLFGAATDRDTLDYPPNDPLVNPSGLPRGQREMYRAYQRQNGEIGIARWSTTGAFTYLATANSPAVAANFWNSYELTVTPTQITFTRTLVDGTKYTVTAADTMYRGPYFFIEKEEGVLGDAPAPVGGAWRSIIYTPTA